jgi:hypothetical protein
MSGTRERRAHCGAPQRDHRRLKAVVPAVDAKPRYAASPDKLYDKTAISAP